MVAMVEQENTQTVMDLYAAFGRGDLPAVLAALADDVEWALPGPANIPMAGTRPGEAGRAGLVRNRRGESCLPGL